MSANGASLDHESAKNDTLEPQLDITKLHALPSEQQDLFLLTHASDLLEYAQSLSKDATPAQQLAVKKEVVKLVGLNAPAPSRVVRQNLGQTLAQVFRNGSTQILRESIHDLLAVINAGKSERDLTNKHTAVTCTGLLFLSAGRNAVSLAAITCSSLIKLLKSAANHAGLKGSILRALSQVVSGLSGSLDEQIARDIWRSARSLAAGDKSTFVQRNACMCLRTLVKETTYFLNTTDLETVKSISWKLLEGECVAVRNAASSLLVSFLLMVFSRQGPSDHAPIVRAPKKSKKSEKTTEDEDEDERPASHPLPKAAPQLSWSLHDCLSVLSLQFCKPAIPNRARAGIAFAYKLLFEGLSDQGILDRYAEIANHLFNEVLNYPTITNNRYRLLLTRQLVHHLLSDVFVAKLLTENGQINAARWLVNDVLKAYPRNTADRREPSKRALTAALRALAHLLETLGPASSVFQDSCREALFQCLQHPSYTVQVHAAHCLRAFTRACPQQLEKCLDQALVESKKEFESPEARSLRHATGLSMSIAAMLSTARQSPLHSSVSSFARSLDFATDLLKASATAELRLCAVQVQAAWTIIGGLMVLGPSFVKVHLNQLLLLWRNASRPPLAQDTSSKRGQLVLSFLTHVRECALTAMLAFLRHNSGLITSDGSKRVSAILQNSAMFLNALPVAPSAEDVTSRLVPALQLQDHAVMLRRRILQCMTRLMGLKSIEHGEATLQSDIFSLTLQTFLYPERPTQKNLEVSLASSASTFEGLWELGDNWGYGISTISRDEQVQLPTLDATQFIGVTRSTEDTTEYSITHAASFPIMPALEHDMAHACGSEDADDPLHLASPFTACVSAAIQLFAVSFPRQPARVQESAVEQLATALSQTVQREPGKKAAMELNAVTALVSALAVANGDTSFAPGKLACQQITKFVSEILNNMLSDPDTTIRECAGQALGRLCNLGGSQAVAAEVKQLVNMIVTNRDPNARAGCALALGHIHSQVGAMAATNHLKTIVGVLLSLCKDSHPIVHFWALRGLAAVAESAGLTFSGYASSSLGMLAQLYTSDAHNEESASTVSSNAEMNQHTTLVICQCVNSMINVLGPDLQDIAKTRNLILMLIRYFHHEDSISLQVQSYICAGHVSLYAPAHVHLAAYVSDLQTALTSGNPPLEKVALTGLETAMKRSASEVFRVAKPGLGDDLWTRLDRSEDTKTLQSILRTWMQQTCLEETSEWVTRCQNVLSRTRARKDPKVQENTVKSAAPDLADEEVAGLSTAAAMEATDSADAVIEGQEYLRWQTRGFAMELLSEIFQTVQHETLPDQIIPAEAMLQRKVADVVRVAFSASTATVVALRLWGLRILDQVLKLFGKTPDPDFAEASLLEQYQAQISSALTPAFAADSTPELAAEAITVCATFVGTGIVTNADRMGRIFKVLSTGLENLTLLEPEAAIGDLKDLSLNAQSMLKMALLSGWAQLQLASTEQAYLDAIVHPYIPKLAPLWLSSLQEFAGLRFEPEISNTLGGEFAVSAASGRYGSFDREVRLKFFQSSWLSIADAIVVLVEKDSNAVFDALDNKTIDTNGDKPNGDGKSERDMSFREEPVAFFFILFGLAYEALVTQARESPSQVLAILHALKKILTPAVSGNAIYQDVVFTETTDTLDRLALTSTSETQAVLVEIARNLSIDHVVAKSQERNDKLSDDIDQLFELTRIVILVLIGLVPTLEDPPGMAHRMLTEMNVALVQTCYQALVDVSEVFPSIIRGDLHACIVHSYCVMLATGICQDEVIPRIMPVLRDFFYSLGRNTKDEITVRVVCGGLSQMLSTLQVAQRRENDYSLICAKNTLLSITVLLSTASRVIPSNQYLVQKAISEVFDCVQDVGLAKVAATCIRTLLMTNPKSACDETIGRDLWSRVLLFVTDPAAEDSELVKPILIQALVSSVATIRGDGRCAAMAILIPSLLLISSNASTNPQADIETAQRLLELAAVDALAFRISVALLEDEQRSQLETLLRSVGVGGGNRSSTLSEESEESKPAIELRMDF